jgi:hypothetical protein
VYKWSRISPATFHFVPGCEEAISIPHFILYTLYYAVLTYSYRIEAIRLTLGLNASCITHGQILWNSNSGTFIYHPCAAITNPDYPFVCHTYGVTINCYSLPGINYDLCLYLITCNVQLRVEWNTQNTEPRRVILKRYISSDRYKRSWWRIIVHKELYSNSVLKSFLFRRKYLGRWLASGMSRSVVW